MGVGNQRLLQLGFEGSRRAKRVRGGGVAAGIADPMAHASGC